MYHLTGNNVQNKACILICLNKMNDVFVEFAERLWPNSEIELYIISATVERFLWWNYTILNTIFNWSN